MTDELLAFFGRLHPAILHLPIGLLIGVALLELLAALRPQLGLRPAIGVLAWIAAIVAAVSATSGWMLAREPDYGGDALELHRWLGIALAGAALLLALSHGRRGRSLQYRAALATTIILVIVTGHFGGTLTHGDGFVTEPLRAAFAGPSSTGTSTTMFEASIQPIFVANCASCHNASKKKGGLSLGTPEELAAGGKHGVVFVAGDAARSELVRRIRLPIDDEDHMPPEDKRQPSAADIATIEAWIANGASFVAPSTGATIAGSAPADTKRSATALAVSASPEQLDALHAALVHVQPVEPGSVLLWIDFAAPASAKRADDAFVARLLRPIAPFVQELALASSSITDSTLEIVATMSNLRRLDVRATNIDDAGVALLHRMPNLEELNLVRTKATDASIGPLLEMPALKRAFLWSSAMTPEGVRRLREAKPGLVADAGDSVESKPLEVEPVVEVGKPAATPATTAVVAAAVSLLPVNLACPVSGKPVDPKYAVVYEGKVIGFCCQNCAKQFLDDPKAFADKIR